MVAGDTRRDGTQISARIPPGGVPGIHGGPSPRVVGVIAALAFVFGVAVLAGELLG